METKQVVRLKLDVPESLLKFYEQQAGEQDVYIEDLMVARLSAAKQWDDDRPLHFSDDERQELETMMGGKLLQNPRQAIETIKALLTIKVGGVNIVVDGQTLKGINAAKASNESESDVIKREVKRALGDYGGTW
tara:strand:- start:42 stop:443 length:402 start_codon:yes stop_codon:yes gene_type:complete